ncbi:hypothetical protein CJJ07_001319 [Candidozyma auris]|nr:hypothetical protein CJJ07_001319 [[Candida] auris]QEL58910.1 hypothetical protein CJJ09_000966 [[Candida] auris]
MSSGSSAPILSYKKRPQGHDDRDSQLASRSPRISTQSISSPVPGSSPSTPGTPTFGGSARKVSSRRKALQDFYKLNHEGDSKASSAEPEGDKERFRSTGTDESEAKEQVSQARELNSPEEIDAFIKSATVTELLRIRNQASGKLNFHDSEKKSIIYDNYYELIKLNQILSDLSGQEKKKSVLDEDEKKNNIITEDQLNHVMGELTSFLDHTASKFNREFTEVVSGFTVEAKRSESLSSITGIKGTDS